MRLPGAAAADGGASSAPVTDRAITAAVTGKCRVIDKAVPMPITLRVLDRIPAGTDPMQDVVLIRIIDRKSGEPSGPINALLIRDLAKGVAEGSLRLANASPSHRRQASGWEAPRQFEGVMRRLIGRIRAADFAHGGSEAWTRPGELLCKTAHALRVPNTDDANYRFIDAVWSSEHGAALGIRPDARTLTSIRAAFLRRNRASVPTSPYGIEESGGLATPNRKGGPRVSP